MDSNHRPHAYQACALTSWAIGPKYLKRVTRIELATTAWKAVVLPLNYTRIIFRMARDRIELPTPWASIKCSTNWATEPSEYYIHLTVPTGIEPAISCVTGRHVNPYTTEPNCGSRTRTYDLRVMSPTSCQLLHPAIILRRIRDSNPCTLLHAWRFSRPFPSAGLG